jgi:hypothetical protein
VTSRVRGTGASLLPADATTAVAWTASLPSGATTSGQLVMQVGSTVVGPRLPVGTVLRLVPADPAPVPHATWGPASVTPEQVVITQDTVTDAAVDRTLTTLLVRFTVRVVVTGLSSATPRLTIPVVYTTATGLTGTMQAPIDGTSVSSPELPQGTTVTLALGDLPAATNAAIRDARLGTTTIVLDGEQHEVVAQVLADDHPVLNVTLASTGADALGLGALATTLVGLGSVLLVARRRRPAGRHLRG